MADKILARSDQARAMNERLSELATTDDLSGLANRRAFDAALAAEWRRAELRGELLALAMIDADHFKSYNDHYGHVAGDACLRTLGEVFATAVRTDIDLAARYGGEEFALLLPGTNSTAANAVAERLRAAVEARCLTHAWAPSGHVTVSIGVASLRPVPGEGSHILVEAADAALYAAKHGGRNTVVVHDPSAGAMAATGLPVPGQLQSDQPRETTRGSVKPSPYTQTVQA
jgi:diguanylate cyclase (GGDEF)-like protein